MISFQSDRVTQLYHLWTIRSIYLYFFHYPWDVLDMILRAQFQMSPSTLDCLKKLYEKREKNSHLYKLSKIPSMKYIRTIVFDSPVDLTGIGLEDPTILSLILSSYLTKIINHNQSLIMFEKEEIKVIIRNNHIAEILFCKEYDYKTHLFSADFWLSLDKFDTQIPTLLHNAISAMWTIFSFRRYIIVYNMEKSTFDRIKEKMEQSFAEKDESFLLLRDALIINFSIVLYGYDISIEKKTVEISFLSDIKTEDFQIRFRLYYNVDNIRENIRKKFAIYLADIENMQEKRILQEAKKRQQEDKKREQERREARKARKQKARKQKAKKNESEIPIAPPTPPTPPTTSVQSSQEMERRMAELDRLKAQREQRLRQEKEARLKRQEKARVALLQKQELLRKKKAEKDAEKEAARLARLEAKKQKERRKRQEIAQKIAMQKSKKEEEKPFRDALRFLRKHPDICKYLSLDTISNEDIRHACTGSKTKKTRLATNPRQTLSTLEVLDTKLPGAVRMPLFFSQHVDLVPDLSPSVFQVFPLIKQDQQKTSHLLQKIPLQGVVSPIDIEERRRFIGSIVNILRNISEKQKKRLLSKIIYSHSISLVDLLRYIQPSAQVVQQHPATMSLKPLDLENVIESINNLAIEVGSLRSFSQEELLRLPEDIKSVVLPSSRQSMITGARWIENYLIYPKEMVQPFIETILPDAWTIEDLIVLQTFLNGYLRLCHLLHEYGILLVIKGGQALRYHLGIPTNDIDVCIVANGLDASQKKRLAVSIAYFFQNIQPIKLQDRISVSEHPTVPVVKVRFKKEKRNRSILEINYEGCVDLAEKDVMAMEKEDGAIRWITMEYYLREQTQVFQIYKDIRDVRDVDYYRNKTLDKITTMFTKLLS